ncbi:MAG: hypothetical protein F6K40_29630 [Okeania sp. SIO3I5]|uniref:hypothetical protein n=1 Tax=Okeania sp. SIO3I5 TaxID=2607805 RepID=UPI0013B924DD|nr:hypothetical protein [Okeania sp. SIO3I5]NEQ40179.1 hypothetical protein [Okeania sp. SIO3I5]
MKATMENKYTSTNPLGRFVTRDALSFHLGIKSDNIYKISCWKYVIHVVGKGKSRFVSYADMPPVLGVEPPRKGDFAKWRKRIKTRKQKYVPKFWAQFYVKQIEDSNSVETLLNWKSLVSQCKSLISLEGVKKIDQAVTARKLKLEEVSNPSY